MSSYTNQQRRALHKWCRQCEQYLNQTQNWRVSPINPKRVFRWGEGDFKYYIYKPFLLAYTGKKSTEEQDSVDPGEVYLALSSHFQTDHGMQLPPWPSNT